MRTTEEVVDAFILFNERESDVPKIVTALEARNVKTYFWKDIPLGQSWAEFEEAQLEKTRTVVLLLGAAGWGPNHEKLTAAAIGVRKRILPVLIGDPPRESFEKFNGLFGRVTYLDLRQATDEQFDRLAKEILRDNHAGTRDSTEIDSRRLGRIERIISELVDGNEEQREWALRQVIQSDQINKKALGARLREEISKRFSPKVEKEFESASRNPKIVASVRSWMMSCLLWADCETEESRNLILDHLSEQLETDRNVRFWTLAGLYHREASYLSQALQVTQNDSAREVDALHKAIARPNDEKVLATFRSELDSPDFRRN